MNVAPGGPLRREIGLEFSFEASSHRHSDHAADDRSGHKFGKPMDGHRNAQPDVERVQQRQENKHFVFRMKRDQANRHGEGHGGVRRRPAPKNAAFEKTELEAVAGVYPRSAVHHGVGEMPEKWRRQASSKRLVTARNEIAEQGRLPQRPSRHNEPAVSCGLTGNQNAQTSQDWQKGPKPDARAGEQIKRVSPRPTKISPVAAGHDDNNRQDNGRSVPPEIVSAEDGNDISGKPAE